jgi:hypothetical protein
VTRLATLARYGLLSKAQTIERAPEPKRTALVAAVVRGLEAAAIGDALDLFALLMATRLISPARRVTERDRLAMLPALEKASRMLARASRVLFTELGGLEKRKAALDPGAVWAAIEKKVTSRSAVVSALATVEQLVPEDDGSAETALRTVLGARYNTACDEDAYRILSAPGQAASGINNQDLWVRGRSRTWQRPERVTVMSAAADVCPAQTPCCRTE